jgi:hypothetical protein
MHHSSSSSSGGDRPLRPALQVSFEQPPRLQGKPARERHEYWGACKLLQQGSLVALWSEARAGPRDPDIVFATISNRSVDLLAGVDRRGVPLQGTAASEPSVGIRWGDLRAGRLPWAGAASCAAASRVADCAQPIASCPPPPRSLCDLRQLQQFVELWQARGRGEVVLLQASASYFAVAPILRALQAGCRMGALERYVLARQGAQQGGWGDISPPAYTQEPGAGTFDLWQPLVSRERVEQLPLAERDRCAGMQPRPPAALLAAWGQARRRRMLAVDIRCRCPFTRCLPAPAAPAPATAPQAAGGAVGGGPGPTGRLPPGRPHGRHHAGRGAGARRGRLPDARAGAGAGPAWHRWAPAPCLATSPA